MMERLHKVLAQAGVASRRKAEELILAGRVQVDGKEVRELGTKVDPASSKIVVDGRPIKGQESAAYVLLNKPRGYVSDTDVTADRPSALELVDVPARLYPAGRLDWNSEGLLFLTNDGDLAFRLTHPRYEHQKEYLVLVMGHPDDAAIEKMQRGIHSEGELLRADQIARAGRHQAYGEAGRDHSWLRIVLHEGKKRQIRRMCSAIGHPVRRLIRTRIGPLKLGDLAPGKWRRLTGRELAELKTTLKLARS